MQNFPAPVLKFFRQSGFSFMVLQHRLQDRNDLLCQSASKFKLRRNLRISCLSASSATLMWKSCNA